jgi:predicted ester cyclase
MRIEVPDALSDGDRTAARCLVTGNEAGTEKPIKFTGIVISRWRDGKIVEAWNNFDLHLVEQQLR